MLPAFSAFISAFSLYLLPVSLGDFFVKSDKGKKVISNELKILLNSIALFLFCVANIILILLRPC